jgi:hypothetical protein
VIRWLGEIDMESLSPEVLATLVAAEFAEAHRLGDAGREQLAARIETALRRAAREEREACVAVCMQRHAMWEATENRATFAEPLRGEARMRANEAVVIADALRAR